MTPAETKQLRLDTLKEMYEIVRIAIGAYRKNPTELMENQIRDIKTNADDYKRKFNL